MYNQFKRNYQWSPAAALPEAAPVKISFSPLKITVTSPDEYENVIESLQAHNCRMQEEFNEYTGREIWTTADDDEIYIELLQA